MGYAIVPRGCWSRAQKGQGEEGSVQLLAWPISRTIQQFSCKASKTSRYLPFSGHGVGLLDPVPSRSSSHTQVPCLTGFPYLEVLSAGRFLGREDPQASCSMSQNQDAQGFLTTGTPFCHTLLSMLFPQVFFPPSKC